MTTWTVNFYPYNILELGTVTVTGTPDIGYPESRLYDRAISLYWKDTVTEAKNFTVDQGATGNLEVDFLAISKHNFNGIAMQWQYSTDDFSADTNDAVTDWTQEDNLQIIKTMVAGQTKRYWRVTLASMANPQCSEIFMSKEYSFDVITDPNSFGRDMANVQWNRTVGGLERSTKFGVKRKVYKYNLFISASEWTDLQTVLSYLNDYAKPFYFKDHFGNYFMAKFDTEPVFDFSHNTYTRVTVSIIEQL